MTVFPSLVSTTLKPESNSQHFFIKIRPNTFEPTLTSSFRNEFHSFRTILFQNNTRLSFGCTCSWVHYRLFSVWTLVPVRLGKQLSDHSTVDEIASGAADCRLTYTMANYPQRRLEKPAEEKKEGEREKEEKELEKTRADRFRKRRGESQSFLFRDADQESKTRMRNNALRTGPRQAEE
ncbi:hypothetical protein TNCV_2183231 [Trichonephila clavipes]|nr:hypothetical protein TNCV_2183231 [Trichonephila clavipes]